MKDLEKRLGKMTVGAFLRSWRMSEGMSQKAFAKKIGISVANLCDIEKGRKGVSPEKAESIAEVLGYSPSVLVKLAIQEQLSAKGLLYDVEVKPAA
jgi:transcriptional regulator with XRE-family HTH domain